MEVTVHIFQCKTPVKLNILSFLENGLGTTKGQPQNYTSVHGITTLSALSLHIKGQLLLFSVNTSKQKPTKQLRHRLGKEGAWMGKIKNN